MRTKDLAIAAGAGVVAGVLAFILDMPGNGLFVWTTLGLGALAGVLVGTRIGALAAVLGASAAMVVIMGVGLASSGLLLPIVAILGGLLALGYLAGWVIRQVALRRGSALREPRVISALIALAVIGAGFWWVAEELARNPL